MFQPWVLASDGAKMVPFSNNLDHVFLPTHLLWHPQDLKTWPPSKEETQFSVYPKIKNNLPRSHLGSIILNKPQLSFWKLKSKEDQVSKSQLNTTLLLPNKVMFLLKKHTTLTFSVSAKWVTLKKYSTLAFTHQKQLQITTLFTLPTENPKFWPTAMLMSATQLNMNLWWTQSKVYGRWYHQVSKKCIPVTNGCKIPFHSSHSTKNDTFA